MMTQTAPAFHKIFVRNIDHSIEFYSTCLGFAEQRRIDAGQFDEVVLKPSIPGPSIVLCRWKDEREIMLGNAHGPTGYFVEEVDAVAAKMVTYGAKGILGPLDYSGMRIAVLSDPDGYKIELLAQL